MRISSATRLCKYSFLVGVVHCAQPIDAPSAFADERYLCDAEHAAELDDRVVACRAAYERDASCLGLVSLRGAIESQALVLDSAVTSLNVIVATEDDGGHTGIAAWSRAPYFESRVAFVNVLAPAAASSGGVAPALSDFINLEARGGNYLDRFVDESRDSLAIAPQEVSFTFRTELERGGYLEGCIHVFSPKLGL